MRGVAGSEEDDEGKWLLLVERAREEGVCWECWVRVSGPGAEGLWFRVRSLERGISFLLSKFRGERPGVG